MIGLLGFVLAILISPFRSKARLEAEIAMLRQQLILLQRKCRGRVRLTNGDRLLFIQLDRAGLRQSSVAKHMVNRRDRPPGQSWQTFLRKVVSAASAIPDSYGAASD